MATDTQSTLLMIEDESAFAQLVTDKLTNAGFEVAWCGKLSEARERLTKDKFGCILLDMSLQTGSGEELINFVRQHKFMVNFETPIFVMSGFLNPPLVSRIKDKVTEILQKPFDYDHLVKLVAKVLPQTLQSAGGGGESASGPVEPEAKVYDTSTEKSFLHILANFIAIADGNVDIAFQRIRAMPKKDSETFLRIHEGLKAIRQAATLLESRRENILKQPEQKS